MTPKTVKIEFKSQREINESRQRKIQQEYKALKKEVSRKLKENYKIAESIGK